MEEKESTKKRKRSYSSSIHFLDSNAFFPLILAALSSTSNSSKSSTLVTKKCLNKLRLSLLSKPSNPNPNPNPNSHFPFPIPILSLIPILLNSKCAEIACRSAEIVGAASLFSLEMNQQIASDGEIVKGLISVIENYWRKKRRVSMAACNAVLDLSTTSFGRQRLLQFSTLQRLLFVFLQVPKSSTSSISLWTADDISVRCPKIVFKENKFSVLLRDAAMILINSCSVEQLEKIPRKLSESFLAFLEKLWAKVRSQMLVGNTSKLRHICSSNIKINSLAESIFRLAINADQLTSAYEVVRRGIFGLRESSFENFMLNHWEVSPFLIRRPSRTLNGEDAIFSSFVQSLSSKETLSSFLSSILQNAVSCLPIASDDLDIISFLKEVRNKLGCPISYQQDIRVVKTDRHLNREVHFFQETSGSSYIKAPQIFYMDDILKCEEAFKEGYTIALRGMEFRCKRIAATADALASLFGQPSVGANMYLTPPNSQGLARHYDDHCVFVCQLFGTKKWTVSCQPNPTLPRLYEPLDSLRGLWDESSSGGCRHFSLREGDVLYIPRGFRHEACTDNGGSNGSAESSLHLTLGIEIEPPFEWEGFAHIALDCWNQSQKPPLYASLETLSGILNVMAVNLLHVVIELIGTSDPTFRKACLVAAFSLPSDTNCGLNLNQSAIFSYMIDKIKVESRFSEALRIVELSSEKNEDPFQRMRWLQHLNNSEAQSLEGHGRNMPFTEIEHLFPLCDQQKEEMEAAFTRVQSRFCDEILFEDVIESYKMLLGKYKTTRKQYMNGMLSLHYK